MEVYNEVTGPAQRWVPTGGWVSVRGWMPAGGWIPTGGWVPAGWVEREGLKSTRGGSES